MAADSKLLGYPMITVWVLSASIRDIRGSKMLLLVTCAMGFENKLDKAGPGWSSALSKSYKSSPSRVWFDL